MATVYLARDTVLRRDVALKMLHPHLLEQEESVKRFTAEAHAIASISHPNVIKVFDYGEAQDKRYMVMEYIDGFTLLRLIEDFRTIPNQIVLVLFAQVLSGLAAVHEKGIFHRDIKPANIMVDRRGQVHIMDFGIAYLVNKESITMTGAFLGSPGHMSPEQIAGGEVTDRTDMFSLGSLMYLCLTGEHPFDAEAPQAVIHKVLTHSPPPVHTRIKQVLFWLSDSVAQCMGKDPATRPSAKDLLCTIEAFCARDGLTIEKSEIVEFLNSGQAYTEKDSEQLFQLYCSAARSSLRGKKTALALRQFEQAERFGNLSNSDKRAISRIQSRKRLIQIAAAGALACVCIFAVTTFFRERGESITIHEQAPVNESISEPALALSAHAPQEEPKNQPESVNGREKHPSVMQKAAAAPSRKNSTSTLARHEKQYSAIHSNQQTYGYIAIKSNPPWATVVIDGIIWGRTPEVATVALSFGKHTLMLEKPGFQPYIDSVTVTGADTIQKRIRLLPEHAKQGFRKK